MNKNMKKIKIKNMKKNILLLIALYIISIDINAQINGTVVNENQKPLETVNVILRTADSIVIEGTTTDKSGKFQLNKNTDAL